MNKALEAAHKARQELKAAGIPIVRTTPLEKLAKNPTSLRMAVNAMCYQCEGEDADPCVRHRIATCENTDCALWNVRPGAREA